MARHFSFAGMQRSGNHAIIQWWHHHFAGYRHRNNIMGLSCKDKAAQFEVDGDYQEQIRIDSWENFNPSNIKISNNSEPLIAIVRDPYNWWASWFGFVYKNPNVGGQNFDFAIKAYLSYVEYAREFPHSSVIFNKWFASSNYRRWLEQDWELGHSDEGLNTIPKLCNGSSFTRFDLQEQAQKMRVLSRYKIVAHVPEYREPLRKYPQLADVSRELFDFEPPKL